MENQNSTEIICILDKSGSMGSLQQETIAGLNQFVKDQKQEEGECNFTLIQFNQEVITSIKRQPIRKVPNLTEESYRPDGYTALLDAVGITLNKAIENQFYLPQGQSPERVLVFIITDGMENASRKYSKAQIQTLIENLSTVKGWEFQFFGANIDAFGEAQNIGISRDKANQWAYNKEGVNSMMNEMSMKSSEFRKSK